MRRSMAGEGEFRRLGPYVLLRTSGAGGMGRVELGLRAENGGTAKLCVLKRMHAELRSPEQEARFRREASIALQLSHDAIAQTVGVEQIDGELLLLQELVHGVDLKLLQTRLASAGERVPLAIAVHIVSEIARALAYAHGFRDLGIVHRDVTPDNVMLAFSGEVKLIDFGIARSNADATLTSTGLVVGRPTYTAPEVWGGKKADRRADIYSLGVVLWQLLTGQRLEDERASGDSPPPIPSALNREVPALLDAVATRALAPDPNRRHQTADELQQALRPFLTAGFRPGRALAELLARHFDVARERRMLAEDVARARRFLARTPRGKEQPAPARLRESGRHAPAAVAASTAVAAPAPVAVSTAGAAPASIAASATTVVTGKSRRILFVAAIGATGLALAVALVAGLKPPPARPLAPTPTAAAPTSGGGAARSAPVPPPASTAHAPASAVRDEPPPEVPTTPPRARQVASSAGRARPPSAKTARPASTLSAEELLRRAQDKFDVGETEAALALARQAVSAGARAPAHVLMGKVMMSERRFDEAEREFAEAVRLDPGDARAARLLALVRETRSSGP
jgi:serine/threonine-protein kinase